MPEDGSAPRAAGNSPAALFRRLQLKGAGSTQKNGAGLIGGIGQLKIGNPFRPGAKCVRKLLLFCESTSCSARRQNPSAFLKSPLAAACLPGETKQLSIFRELRQALFHPVSASRVSSAPMAAPTAAT